MKNLLNRGGKKGEGKETLSDGNKEKERENVDGKR